MTDNDKDPPDAETEENPDRQNSSGVPTESSDVPQTTPDQQEGLSVKIGRVARGLALIGPGPAAMFRDAARLTRQSDGLESRTMLIAHLMREIESAVRDSLFLLAKDNLKPSAEAIAARKLLESADIPRGGALESAIRRVAESNGTHADQVRASVYALELTSVIADRLLEQWQYLTEGDNTPVSLAHRRGFEKCRPVTYLLDEVWPVFVSILDDVLQQLEERFVIRYLREVDRLAAIKHPRREHILSLNQNIPSLSPLRQRFFSRLKSHRWLAPLQRGGFFNDPPEPSVAEDDGSVRQVPWPASRCLVRFAADKNAESAVSRILGHLADRGTQNAYVQQDMLEAAYAMNRLPPQSLTAAAISWAESGNAQVIGRDLGAYAAHLADLDDPEPALEVLRRLLTLEPGGDPMADDEFGFGGLRPPPRPRLGPWEIDDVLKNCLPRIRAAAPVECLELLADVLAAALDHSRPVGDDSVSVDLSAVWRPDIDGPGPEYKFGLVNTLINAVRDTAEFALKTGAADLVHICDVLEKRGWTLFQRIALHFLAQDPAAARDTVAARILSRESLEDHLLEIELYRLVEKGFALLNEEQRSAFVEMILAGRTPVGDDETSDRIGRRWQQVWLSAVRRHLPGKAAERLVALESEFGPVGGPRRHYEVSAARVGPTSPLEPRDLEVLAPEAIVSHLLTWEPSGGFDSPSRDGLARVLTEVTTDRASEISVHATSFIGIDATYARGLLDGLTVAVSNEVEVDWEPVLRFCEWVVDQPREIPGRAEDDWADEDPHWGWSRKALASLLREGLHSVGLSAIPIRLRERVWNLISGLLEDPDPSRADEESQKRGASEAVVSTINSVRGEALRAVVEYGLWVRRWQQTQPDSERLSEAGFDEMHEVREALNRHLDPNFDDALGTRAVYGLTFPWLHLLDRSWAEEAADLIFSQPKDTGLPQAAWNAYVKHCPPFWAMLEVLQGSYSHAVHGLEAAEEGSFDLDSADLSLVRHLALFFMWGAISQDPGDLLSTLLERGSPATRKLFLDALGRLVADRGRIRDHLKDEEKERLTRFLEQRYAVLETTGQDFSELAPVGWLLISGTLDTEWCLNQLLLVVKHCGHLEPDHAVIEALVEHARDFPKLAVAIATEMAQRSADQWFVARHHMGLESLLERVLASEDEDAVADAKRLCNWLVRNGHTSFGDLAGLKDQWASIDEDRGNHSHQEPRAEGPLSKSDSAKPKQSKIYKDKTRKTPVNKTTALVARGKGGPRRRRGEVTCAHCGKLIKATEMKRHLMVVHNLKNIVMNDGPRRPTGTKIKPRSDHVIDQAKGAVPTPLGLCICGWCNQEVSIRQINRHTRRQHPGKTKKVKMTSDDPRWNDR